MCGVPVVVMPVSTVSIVVLIARRAAVLARFRCAFIHAFALVVENRLIAAETVTRSGYRVAERFQTCDRRGGGQRLDVNTPAHRHGRTRGPAPASGPFMPKSMRFVSTCTCPCGCIAAPMTPKAMTGRPPRVTNAGMIVWNGRLPGAKQFA